MHVKHLLLVPAIVGATLAMAAIAPTPAHAFCGFYIDGAGKKMFNEATQVVMMRKGTHTVLSMRNTYQGPVEDFAMVVPVPVVLQEDDVKTLPADIFDKIDTMGSPRLVEYWEQDPCGGGGFGSRNRKMASRGSGAARSEDRVDKDLGVTVEAQFTVGEYEIVILSAKESTGLDTWLRAEGYKIPTKAEAALRPYVEAGSKFFVAKVDPKKVTFVGKRAQLSPLRFDYDSDSFELPVRLGLINSAGTQDLIVNILSPGQRYEVANYKNVTVPTNIEVTDDVRKRFDEFYVALFDRTIARNPGAVVTEYAWDAGTCDPCPGPMLTDGDFQTLGADVMGGGSPRGGKGRRRATGSFVLTRLHVRYGKADMTDDLVFKAANPIVGGREFLQDDGKLEEGAREDSINNFQARYIIRHPWTGKIACKDPQRGIWGGPPHGDDIAFDGQTRGAGKLAFAPRGKVKLPRMIKQDVPEVGLKKARKKRKKVKKPAPPATGSGSAQGKTGALE
ncbi:MAG: DUF2330 domain-containing protein, partial [Myxococcales bacterium]|nr:DUF2330 domain-containing protein [Myxococcales bacterium]